MAGAGEVSAIIGHATTASKISKAVIDSAGRYQAAKYRIQSFGVEVGSLGSLLDQLHYLYGKDDLDVDDQLYSVALNMVEQCGNISSEVDGYRNML